MAGAKGARRAHLRMTADDFWERTEPEPNSGCLLWLGAPTHRGYGQIQAVDLTGYKNRPAHRIAWALTFGDPGDIQVLHRCDNRKCVNPAHLFLGTQADNVHDCIAKGRFPRVAGERNGQSKVTSEQVESIRRAAATGMPQRQIARLYGLSQQGVSHIVRRETWA